MPELAEALQSRTGVQGVAVPQSSQGWRGWGASKAPSHTPLGRPVMEGCFWGKGVSLQCRWEAASSLDALLIQN